MTLLRLADAHDLPAVGLTVRVAPALHRWTVLDAHPAGYPDDLDALVVARCGAQWGDVFSATPNYDEAFVDLEDPDTYARLLRLGDARIDTLKRSNDLALHAAYRIIQVGRLDAGPVRLRTLVAFLFGYPKLDRFVWRDDGLGGAWAVTPSGGTLLIPRPEPDLERAQREALEQAQREAEAAWRP